MKYLIISDLETTTQRIPLTRKILTDLRGRMAPDHVLAVTGDIFREYNAATTGFIREIFDSMGKPESWYLVGNHDREVNCDRISPLFPGAVVKVPTVRGNLAWLPAPDRSAFGASRGPEGRKARDAALSEALEAAVIALETQIGPENLSKSVLFFHGAVSSAEITPGQIAAGLTWSIPAARLSRWGLAIGGHLHAGSHSENIWGVGGVANWQFTDRAESFRALVVDTETLSVESIPLLRALVPIELALDDEGLHAPGMTAMQPLRDFPSAVLVALGHAGVDSNADTVTLKIKARLPQHDMTIVPTGESLMEALNDQVERKLIQNCIITRETTGLHKARLTTEQSAREMSLDEMLDLYVETSGNGTGPETVLAAKDRIERIAEYYRPGRGMFGFKPVRLELVNFRQWGAASLDFQSLEGAVALTGAMASGKSNLLEAIMVALYKRSPSSTGSIEDELRLGATAGSIELTFEARGKQYLVRRAFERGKGGVSCKSELFELEIDTTASAVCEAANDIDKRIVEMLGSYEFTLSTIFRAQRDIDRLIEATPAQWHKLMLEALALERFEPLRKAAANQADTAALRGTQETTVIEELESQLANVSLEVGGTDEAALQEDVDRLKDTIAIAEHTKGWLDTDRQGLIEKRAGIRNQLNQRADLERRAREAKRAFAEIVITDIGERPAPFALPDTSTVERQAHLKDELRAGEAGRDETLHKILAAKSAVAKHEREIASLTGAISQTDKRLAEWQQAKEKLPESNCEKQRGQKEACYFYQTAVRPETAKRLIDEGESYQAKRREHAEDLGRARASVTELETTAADLQARHEALTEQLKAVNANLEAAAKRDNEIASYDIRANAQKQLVEQRTARALEVTTIEAQLAAAANPEADLSEVLKGIEKVENRIGAQDGIIKAARSAMREADARLVRLEGARKRVTEIEASIAEHKATAGKHVVDRIAWELVASAFHHTGIPYLLMERVMGGFEKIANEILETTGLTVQIETVTPTKKGEARDRLTVRFTDERGQHWLSQASGGQSTTVSMALSAALAIVGSQFWGAVPELFVQDEGFSRFGEGAQDVARQLIAAIGRRFQTFVYITHELPLAESADMHLRVEADGGVSRLVGK